LGIPVTVSVRSAPDREYPGRLNRFLAKLLFTQAQGVVLQTSQARAFFPPRIQRKSIILANPLNDSFFIPLDEGVRRKDIVWVGRIDENKNPYMLVEAFRGLAEEFPDWNVHFYGDGESFSKLQELCKQYGLAHRMILEGRVEQVQEAICGASIYVLTSRVEGMPNALMEAMALGLAVVATDCPCGGPAELISQGKNGLLVPVGESKALEEALRGLMSDEEYRERLGREAFTIREKLHPDKVNRQWLDYIEQTGV
jgi:glycosyltransferase involved in cell wall biosynthesis